VTPHRTYLHLAAVAALCATAHAASAHPGLQVKEAAIGASYRGVISIPHGCKGSPTVTVRVHIPEGVIGVKPMPKPGWTLKTVRGPYAHAHQHYHGMLSEGVKEVTWSGKLADEHFDEFVFAGFLSDALVPGGVLYFPVDQVCEKGATRWIEVPAPGQDAHNLAAPAPGVRLLPAAQKTAATSSYKIGALVIEAPWTRATPAGATVAGGYLRITNTGTEPDRLVGGSVPVASTFEVHEMSMTDNVMKMRKLTDGLEIKPGQTVELKPGGYHLMFMGLRQGLKDGQTVKGTLVFEKAGTVEIEYRVAPLGAQSPSQPGAKGGGHSHH
jgi:periplasmic copper chaperone A